MGMKTLKVIKIGGNIIDDNEALLGFLKDFSNLKGPKLLVHGGGKLATDLAQKMGVEVKMIDGRRITDVHTLDIIVMMYAGKINKNIVVNLQANQCNAIGFSGADGNSIISTKRPTTPVDFGFAGDVTQVNTEVLELLINQNITPVFCAITHDKNGQLLNTNADTIASELAIALAKTYQTELYYCFGKSGVLRDINDEFSVIESITPDNVQELIQNKIISDGMLPKIKNSINAINHRVNKVCIGKSEMIFNPFTYFTSITK
ncbi:acetylglutamate kinase [Psychroflexus gondwanensis]|jgi:acetylglutamate kinase|uniref:Acetylglutamate kinase n=1 Tax=Psychroflexus gondwanensis ACAM 44 TaxID=1189619 RepID=N1X2Y2_9FLAO|nr:acetylglutamate kinase [Psychroflexus gondwanensis]EMY82408.1 acetylglutamate kinase [Psychroflexus gondwanensis ACAM 44]TXE18969.1 acetylglutamate kinase [Psychroflexus gondwanensis]